MYPCQRRITIMSYKTYAYWQTCENRNAVSFDE